MMQLRQGRREQQLIQDPESLKGRVLQANEIRLCWDSNKICALVGPDLMRSVSGLGDSVHKALADLTSNLVKDAIWIEVTDRTEWHMEDGPDE